MGAERKQVLFIFLFQGVFLGLTGIILGVVAGFFICYGINVFELIHLPDIYYDTSIPVEMEPLYFLATAGVAFIITVVSSIYPAWQASKLDPLRGLNEVG